MKKIKRAKSAGFCFGVEKAVEKVYREAGKENKVYTLGPIIHNQEVVKDMNKKGVEVIEDVKELENPDKNAKKGQKNRISDALKEDLSCPLRMVQKLPVVSEIEGGRKQSASPVKKLILLCQA